MDCPACKRKISPSVSACPRCFTELGKRESGSLDGSRGNKGRRRKRNSDKILMWGVVGVLAAGMVGAGWWAITPFRQARARAQAVQNSVVLTPAGLYTEIRSAYAARNYNDAISNARLALSLAGDGDSESQDSLEIPLRELLARSYSATGDTVGALTQWRILCRLAPDQVKYQRNVADAATQFNSIGLKVAAGELQQAEELFRAGQQAEAIRRTRLALELYKEHAGSKQDLAHSEAALGQMLWTRRELTRARDCLERAAVLGYSEPAFLKILDESRRGLTATGNRVPAAGPTSVGPNLDEREAYPRSRQSKDEWKVSPPGTKEASSPRVAVSAGTPRAPRKDQPKVVLPSVQIPDSMVRGGGLPTYDRPNGGGDVLPSYRGTSITGAGVPGYNSPGGVHPTSDRLPTY